MKKEILLLLLIIMTYSTCAIGQLGIIQTVKIEIESTGDESTGFIIGVEGKKMYIATVGHGKENLEEKEGKAQIFFYTKNVKNKNSIIPLSGAYTAKLYSREPYRNDVDLLFLEVELPSKQVEFIVPRQKTMNLFQIKEKVEKKAAVFSLGHPKMSTVDNSWRADTQIEKEKGDNLFILKRGEIKEGFSGAPVYHTRTKRLMGMVKRQNRTDVECLNITQIKTHAKESGISENILILDQPNYFLSKRTKWFGYTGVGTSLFALANRIYSDNIYEDYLRDGKTLTPTEFEEFHGKSLEEMYNTANRTNQISYIAGGIGVGLLIVAVIDYHKNNKQSSKRSINLNGQGNALGLTYIF